MIGWLVWTGLAKATCPLDLVDPAAVAEGQPVTVDLEAATHSARPGKLVGTACLYSTGAMAKKVVSGGMPWNYEGSIAEVVESQDITVSSPYTAANGSVSVVATELLDALVSCGYGAQSLALEGRSLEVDGVRYVVLTSFRVPPPTTEAVSRPAP